MSFIGSPFLNEQDFPLFANVLEKFGFIPNLFRAQGDRKDLIESQMVLGGAVITRQGALERRQKEYIFLAVSARNLSTYCVTAHCEIVRMLRLEGPDPEQIALDHAAAKIPLRDKALINFALKLNSQPARLVSADIDALRTFGFTDQHIQEVVHITALARFSNIVAFGLGTAPDFENPQVDFLQPQPEAPSGNGSPA